MIAGLGLASVIDVPLLAMGQVLGTINLLDVAGRYRQADVSLARCIARFMVAPSLRGLQADPGHGVWRRIV